MSKKDDTPHWKVIEAADRGGEKLIILSIGGQYIGAASPCPATALTLPYWHVAVSVLGMPVVRVSDEDEARRYLLAIGGLMTGKSVSVINLEAAQARSFASDAVNA